MTNPQYHVPSIALREFLSNTSVDGLSILPSYQEYDQRLFQFDSAISNYQQEINFHAKLQADPNKASQDRVNLMDSYRNMIRVYKNTSEDYKEAVVQLRRIKDREAIQKEMQIQSKLIEQQIKETFRIQSDQFMTATPANTVNTDNTMTQIVSQNVPVQKVIDKNPVLQLSEENSQSPQTKDNGSMFPLIAMIGVMLG
tara:strand:+ start:254 stop:847 length:594 start_codon:yes stop_codon:yes gene_type:complete